MEETNRRHPKDSVYQTNILKRKQASIAVICGDKECMRRMVYFWIGRQASKVLNGNRDFFKIVDKKRNEIIVTVLDPIIQFNQWPGGTLIWLYPDRGPSEQDLEIIKQFLVHNYNSHVIKIIRIFICMDDFTNEDTASNILDNIEHYLRWAIDDKPWSMEPIWLSKQDWNDFTQKIKESVN